MAQQKADAEVLRKEMAAEEARRRLQKERDAVKLQRTREIDEANNKIRGLQDQIEEADFRLQDAWEEMDNGDLDRNEYLALDSEINAIHAQIGMWQMDIDSSYALLDGLHQAEYEYEEQIRQEEEERR